MKQPRRLIFLDVNGVMCRYESQDNLDPDLVDNLNKLMTSWGIEVVFNSAWNARGIDQLRVMFTAAGIQNPKDLIGVTPGNKGGGDLVREYLIQNDLVGTPYIIIDDSTHNYGEMWCRLVNCDGHKGFDAAALRKADDLLWKCKIPVERRDRELAATHLMQHSMWLASETPWLSLAQRKGYIEFNMEIATHCLVTPDFMKAAMLVAKPPASPKSDE